MQRSILTAAVRRLGGPVAALLLLPVFWGCGREKAAESEAPTARAEAEAAAPAKVEVLSGDADLLQNVAVGTGATNAALLEGDGAWQEFLRAMRPPPVPPEWETNPPTKEALAEFQKENAVLALKIADQAKEFYTKFPNHEMVPEARDREQYLLGVAVQAGGTNVLARLNALEEARLKDPKLSEDDRLQIRVGQLQRSISGQNEKDMPARLTAFEKGARSLMKEFPSRPELSQLLSSVAQGWVDAGQLEKARGLASELVKGDAGQEVKAEAEGLLRRIDRVGKPLAIKFKAMDGREVNLEQLKGKVVLVDFWATWCVPCMAELPNVKAAHARLNPKGFEIVGISLDQQKEALQKVVADQSMTWPQYFDESTESNKLADEFEVASIPTMWLVDKKGNLRDLNGRENLAEKVEKLLAE